MRSRIDHLRANFRLPPSLPTVGLSTQHLMDGITNGDSVIADLHCMDERDSDTLLSSEEQEQEEDDDNDDEMDERVLVPGTWHA